MHNDMNNIPIRNRLCLKGSHVCPLKKIGKILLGKRRGLNYLIKVVIDFLEAIGKFSIKNRLF